MTVMGYDDEDTHASASDTAQVDITHNQPSIMINSLSATLDDSRMIIRGEFNITDESKGGNTPDGWKILLTDYEIDLIINKYLSIYFNFYIKIDIIFINIYEKLKTLK